MIRVLSTDQSKARCSWHMRSTRVHVVPEQQPSDRDFELIWTHISPNNGQRRSIKVSTKS